MLIVIEQIMATQTNVIIATILCYVLLGLPFSCLSIAWGVQEPGNCDYRDPMGLDVGDYLLGSGITGLFFTLVIIACHILWLCGMGEGFIKKVLTIIMVPNILFGTAWFIVGGIILFRSNTKCMTNYQDPSHVVYALVLWCISAFNILVQIIKQCCGK